MVNVLKALGKILLYILLTSFIINGLRIMPTFGFSEIEIKGSTIVSSDGLLTFYIENRLNESITVTLINFSDVRELSPGDSVIYRVALTGINPNPYVQVNYIFQVFYHVSNITKEYVKPVIIISPNFVHEYRDMEGKLGLYVPLLMITTGICLFIGTSYIVEQIWKFVQIVKRRRRKL